jgi:E3 ubiquitin-protein ligase BAH
MKFAKQLEKSLVEEEIPEDWLSAAIQYKALKKCINKVVEELKFLGLEQNTRKLLFENSKSDQIIEINENDTNATNPTIAKYSLSKIQGDDHIVPILKINLDNANFTDEHLLELSTQLQSRINGDNDLLEVKKDGEELVISPTNSFKKLGSAPSEDSSDSRKCREVLIMLNSDIKFFQMLHDELVSLDKLRVEEEQKLIQEVQVISEDLSKVAISKKGHLINNKPGDLYNWRKLFRVYLDSQVYFKYNQMSNHERNVDQIKLNLANFIKNVESSGILSEFRDKKSLIAYNQFLSLKYHLLKVLQFQSINSEAYRKILKKFDKQTNLGISHSLPKLISNDHIFFTGKSIAQSICYIIQSSILTLVPQLEDYTCPICMSVAYKPIRLQCQHLFCVRCLIKMKQQKKVDCPICRCKDVILEADGTNLDLEVMEFMKKYFPIEVKEKLKERDKEKYEQYVGTSGVVSTHVQNAEKCIII